MPLFLRFGNVDFFCFLLGVNELFLCCAEVLLLDALDGIGNGIKQVEIHGLIIEHSYHLT